MRGPVLSAVALLIAAPAFAADVTIGDAWFRALPAGLPAGGYFVVHNAGTETVTLTGASSPACGMLMLHKSQMANGTASMSNVERIAIPGGTALAFAPGGYHLMCMEPAPAMKPGATVSVTLEFADGAKVMTAFAVRNAKSE